VTGRPRVSNSQMTPDTLDAASARVDRFLTEVSKQPVERLRLYAVAPSQAERHRRVVDDAELVAIEQGLGEPLGAILEAVDDWVLRRYADRGYDLTFIGLNWGRSPGTAQDRAAVAASLREAVMAVVLGPVIPDGWAGELLGGWAEIAAASSGILPPAT